jgi:alpha-beta hydrolase superfamily lysophospholipase
MNKKNLMRFGLILLVLFIVGNFIVYNHVYSFTHFSITENDKTKRPEKMGVSEKVKTLFMGVNIPKPLNKEKPKRKYQTLKIESYETLEAWYIEVPNDKGKIIMFHGYSSSKSTLLEYAEEFNKKGYSTLLVDFMGCGGSTGNLTTIGYKESHDVRVAHEFLKKRNPKNKIILFGCSMGAVSIMKSLSDFEIEPDGIILECPFGSFKNTTKIRFQAMNIPSFPFTDLLLIHGGIQLGFNPYKHNPIEYAKNIKIPTLLLFGKKDKRVSLKSIEDIYKNIQGPKMIGILKNSEHEIYLNDDSKDWHKFISGFLNDINK